MRYLHSTRSLAGLRHFLSKIKSRFPSDRPLDTRHAHHDIRNWLSYRIIWTLQTFHAFSPKTGHIRELSESQQWLECAGMRCLRAGVETERQRQSTWKCHHQTLLASHKFGDVHTESLWYRRHSSPPTAPAGDHSAYTSLPLTPTWRHHSPLSVSTHTSREWFVRSMIEMAIMNSMNAWIILKRRKYYPRYILFIKGL